MSFPGDEPAASLGTSSDGGERDAAPPEANGAPYCTLLGAARLDETGEAAKAAAHYARSHGFLPSDAVAHARAALLRRDDPTLRGELAAWTAELGRFHEAALLLMPLAKAAAGDDAGALWLEIAWLHARAGDGGAALTAAQEAARAVVDDPRPWSLIGALSSWSPAVEAETAAAAWLRAAVLQRKAGDKDAAMESRIRAFARCPQIEEVAHDLATALQSRGRIATVDRVLAAHARTQPAAAALELHATRARTALAASDATTALLALLEAGRDALLPGAPLVFGEVLLAVGFPELADAVLTARALLTPGAAAAEAWAALAKVRRDRRAAPAAVLEAIAEALDVNPEREDLVSLAKKVGEADPPALRELLVRALRAAERRARPADAAARALLEQTPDIPELALVRVYAIEQAQAHGLLDGAGAAHALGAAAAAADVLREQIAAVVVERREAEDDVARTRAARRALPLLATSPREEARCLSYLRDLVGLADDGEAFVPAFVKLARRLGDRGALSWIIGRRGELRGSSGGPARLAVLEAARALRDTDAERAALSTLLAEEAGDSVVATSALASALCLGVQPLLVTALRDVTAVLAGPLRAVALAVASRSALDGGDVREARALAARAHEADRTSAAALEAFGAAATHDPQPEDAEILERAASLLVGDARLLGALADVLEQQGEVGASLLWTQRQHTLRPGDPAVVEALLRRASAAARGERLLGIVRNVAELPVPAALLADPLARLLTVVVDEPTEELGRLMLEEIGPAFESVRLALHGAASRAETAALSRAVDLREAAASHATSQLVALAKRLVQAGDLTGGMVALLRATEGDGTRPFEIAEVAATPAAWSGDAELLRMEVLALLAERRGEGDAATRYLALADRRVFACNDQLGGLLALLRALSNEPKVVALATTAALSWAAPVVIAKLALGAVAQKPDEARAAGRLLSAISERCATSAEASEVARAALRIDPSRSDALTALSRDDVDPREIDTMHASAAGAARGVVGRRLAHTRAARLLERRGENGSAFDHARIAFEESPEAPGTLTRAARLAALAGRQRDLVTAMERVASDARSDEAKAHWLLRAASHLSTDEEGIRLRTELALRALRAAPEVSTARALIEAFANEARGADDLDVLAVRFERAVRAALAKRDGPDGARMAILFAEAALDVFSSPRVAVSALIRALELDASIEEFERLYPRAGVLARGEGTTPAESFASSCLAEVSRPFANFGAPALVLATRIAMAIGNVALAARLLPFAIKNAMDELSLRPDVLAVLERSDDAFLRAWEESTRVDEPASDPVDEAAAEHAGTPVEDLAEQERTLSTLAGLADEEGNLPRAKELWQELLKLVPTHAGALGGLERAALAENDPFALASVLTLRLGASTSPDEARVIRLRRAALLEQRLGDVDQARRELESLIEDHDDGSALRYLADLHERNGAPRLAAPLWERALDHATEPRDAHETAVRAARAHFAAQNLGKARDLLAQAGAHGTSERALELRVEVERAAGSAPALGDALDELAISSMESPEARAALLIEAARAALEAETEPLALARAQRAVRIAPFLPEAQLLARLLEYRARGPGNRQEAGQTVEELRRLAANLAEDQVPLHAFLLAEALDVVYGGSAGMRELSVRHAELGPAPLLALGIAERASRAGNYGTALPMFEAALSGDLFGLRHRGHVAIAGARAALAAGNGELARRFIDEARKDTATVADTDELIAEMSEARARNTHDQLLERVATTTGAARAMALLELARARAADPASAADAARLLMEAERAAAGDGHAVADVTAAREEILGSFSPGEPTRVDSPFVDLDEPPPVSTRRRDRALLLPPEGDEIIDADYLAALRERAQAGRDVAHDRAIHSIEQSFRGDRSVQSPPSLAAQREQPDAVRALLTKGCDARIGETLALVWEGAPHLFRREAATYGITGLDRVSFGSATPASRVYTLGARLLGASRAPLFQRRTPGAITASVALLQPAAVVLAGEIRDESPTLSYRLGAALFAAAPERALLFALPTQSLETLLAGIHVAFGTPDASQSLAPDVNNLAAALWQTLPARAQRRLRELSDPAIDLTDALAEATRAVRRAGLYLCGDLRTALAEVLEEERLDLPFALTLDGLANACEASPAVRDLVRFALTPELADARWQDGRSMLRVPASGTLRGTE